MSAADQSRKFRYVLTKDHVSVSKKRHESVDFRRQAGADTGLVTFFYLQYVCGAFSVLVVIVFGFVAVHLCPILIRCSICVLTLRKHSTL